MKDARQEKIEKQEYVIVDDNDEVIGYRKEKTFEPWDIHRATGFWITNSSGEILLAKRAKDKYFEPGMWGLAVAGTVEKGETYFSNAVKEAEEELGLKNIEATPGPKGKIISKNNSYFYQIYLVEIDRAIEDFIIDENEIDALKWFLPAQLLGAVKEIPEQFTDSLKELAQILISRRL